MAPIIRVQNRTVAMKANYLVTSHEQNARYCSIIEAQIFLFRKLTACRLSSTFLAKFFFFFFVVKQFFEFLSNF